MNRLGAGIGLKHPPVAKVPIDATGGDQPPTGGSSPLVPSDGDDDEFEPLTIPEAKARLARTLGVDPASIKITVEA